MRITLRLCALGGALAVLMAMPAAAPQQPSGEARVIPLLCPTGDCPLLLGAPQTVGMRSGFVRLALGQAVGRHTTAGYEETLVILHGQGDALLDGAKRISFTAPAVVYFPPATHHNVLNTGKVPLEYVYIVAPAAGR